MNVQSLLEKIKSKYILEEILSYIKQEYKLKIFVHSNLYQKKLNLKLLDYQVAYINQFGMDINDYLFFDYNKIKEENFQKDYLKKKLENDIFERNLDYNLIQLIFTNYFEDFIRKTKENKNDFTKGGFLIDVLSPFLDAIIKTEAFEFIMEIPLLLNGIKKFNLKEDYISTFDKLNKSNVKYTKLDIEFFDPIEMEYLKDFNINFSHIKKLTVSQNNDFYLDVFSSYDFILKTLFSFKNIENNLIYLDLQLTNKERINADYMGNLNNFKSLEILYLNGFNFIPTFVLKLKNLKELKLQYCDNILFGEEDIFLKLKELNLFESYFELPNLLFKLPELEILKCEYINTEILSKFDFSTVKKLIILNIDLESFIKFEHLSFLENVIIYTENPFSIDDETKMIQKLIKIDTLKSFNINLCKISDEEISNIQGENKSVIEATIFWKNRNNDCIIYNLQNKFPNIAKLTINHRVKNNNNSEVIIEIKENKDSKVNKLNLNNLNYKTTKLYCQPFENLIKIKIYLEDEILNLKRTLPIFSDDCKVIFKSLKSFHLKMDETKKMNLDILKNLYNNINKMPKLEKLILKFNIKELDEEFYKNFVEKILLLKIINVHIDIKKDCEQKEEYYLKKDYNLIFPNIKFDYHYEEIYIQKYIK